MKTLTFVTTEKYPFIATYIIFLRPKLKEKDNWRKFNIYCFICVSISSNFRLDEKKVCKKKKKKDNCKEVLIEV